MSSTEVSTSYEVDTHRGLHRLFSRVARVVTDTATFAWLCDVFVVEEYRGRGLGKWLIETIVAQPILQPTLFVLATRDAHGLYQEYGDFGPLPAPDRWMAHRRPGPLEIKDGTRSD